VAALEVVGDGVSAGVQLVISDHHLGLKAAIASVFIRASWQRCRVHFMLNVLARVPKGSAEMVAAAIRTVFAQPDTAHVRSQMDEVTRMLDGQFPDVAAMLTDATEDLLAFTSFPEVHWKKIWSTNPLERLNGEIKRRTNVVGIFPQPPRTAQRRDQASHQRGRHLPQRRQRLATRDRRGGRDPRRMASRRSALPLRRINGEALHERPN
jgi:transposase-like protein